jgi:hypothetical protein
MRFAFPPYSSTSLGPKLCLGTKKIFAKLSLASKGVPKLELGNEKNKGDPPGRPYD